MKYEHSHIDGPVLSAYVDGELPASAREAVEDHLSGCARCREQADQMRQVSEMAGALPRQQAPSHLWREVEQEIDEEPTSSRPATIYSLLGSSSRRLAVAAAVVLVAFGTLFYAADSFLGDSEEPAFTDQLTSSTKPLGVDYGLYMAGLTEPPAMETFERQYQRRPVSSVQASDDLKALPGAFPGLELRSIYRLQEATHTVLEATYQHEGSRIAVFRQPKGRPVQFTGYEAEPAAVDGRQCLMVQDGRYCAFTFATGPAQYIVIGPRDDAMVTRIISYLLDQ